MSQRQPRPETDRRRDDLGLPVLPPLNAFVELALLVGLFLLIDWLLPDVDLPDIKPNPLWLPVLLLSLQYGTVSGLMAALFAILLTVYQGFPEEGVGENHFAYVLRVWAEPILWIGAAVVLGQFRLRQIAAWHELRVRVDELAVQRAHLADYAGRMRQRCEILERGRAGERATPSIELLHALGVLSHSREDELGRAFLDCMAIAFPGAHASVFVRDGPGARRIADTGADEASRRQGVLAPAHPLVRAVLDAGESVSVLVAGDEAKLAGEGLVAVPIRAADGCRVAGLLKLETAPAAYLTPETTLALEVLAAALAPCLEPVEQPVEQSAPLVSVGRLRRAVRWGGARGGLGTPGQDEARQRARPLAGR